jgi:hypothetical protein
MAGAAGGAALARALRMVVRVAMESFIVLVGSSEVSLQYK